MPVASDSANVESKSAIRRLHDEYIPEIFGGVSAAEVYVTGETAYTMEFYDTAKRAVFIVFPFVLAMSFLLLMLVFRSIIVPIKAIILNLLVCWFWCVTITSLRWIGVRQTDYS